MFEVIFGCCIVFFFSSTRRHTICALVTGVQTCARPISLVDDDKNILTSVSIALQTEGFLTRLYSDPEAALKALIENPADLAVFDIKMPRMDGLELLRRLREKSHMPEIGRAHV